jgi:hypothetical protein
MPGDKSSEAFGRLEVDEPDLVEIPTEARPRVVCQQEIVSFGHHEGVLRQDRYRAGYGLFEVAPEIGRVDRLGALLPQPAQ